MRVVFPAFSADDLLPAVHARGLIHLERARLNALEHGCWRWPLRPMGSGYGQLGWTRGGTHGVVLAHRFAYAVLRGPIPAGMTVDHLCRVRICVNPDHLRLLSNPENAALNAMAARTHCPRGHEYSPENTRLRRNGHRACIACDRERQRATYYKSKVGA